MTLENLVHTAPSQMCACASFQDLHLVHHYYGGEVMTEKQPTIRQVLVITDGCSNVGVNPVECAAKARLKSIAINVVGVVDKGDMGNAGRTEVMSIADAGGGMCRIVLPTELSATAQMMTHQTMQMTLQQVVNQELLQVMGKQTEDLPPQERSKIMKVVDKLEEEVRLELVVAVDTSASMQNKMAMVRDAIRDMALSLQARQGEVQVAVISFPGSGEIMVRTVQGFHQDVDIKALDGMLVARGGTPTGPAIDYAVAMFDDLKLKAATDDYPSRRWDGEPMSS